VHDLDIVLDLISKYKLISIGLRLSEHYGLASAGQRLAPPVDHQQVSEHGYPVVEGTVYRQVIHSLGRLVLQVLSQIHNAIVLLQVLARNLPNPGRDGGREETDLEIGGGGERFLDGRQNGLHILLETLL
jgi:hypothetical protein